MFASVADLLLPGLKSNAHTANRCQHVFWSQKGRNTKSAEGALSHNGVGNKRGCQGFESYLHELNAICIGCPIGGFLP